MTQSIPPKLRELIAADQLVNAGSRGWRKAVAAFVFHPGFATMFLHRLAVALNGRGHGRCANLIWRWNTSSSGCHFHLDSRIAPGCRLPHPTAIVIGSGVEIGPGATIYQGVTLGKAATREEYPVVGSDVTLFPNAIIVGGVRIGDGAVVGAAAIVVKDVPAGAVVASAPAVVLRTD
jgi:serine O-acetyltransferase